MDQVVDSPVGRLQFANNIVSVSMGFFTHSASQAPDERYLEVLLGMPDILQESTDLRVKVEQLFSQYGPELLAILSNDTEIYNDKEVAGYGLNFSWRSLAQTPSGPHLTLEGAVVYVPKEEAHKLLDQQIALEELLGRAVIFARQGEHPAKLVRRLPSAPSPEVRAPTQQKTAAASSQVPTSVLETEVEEKPDEPPAAPSAPLAKAHKSEVRAPAHQQPPATPSQVPTSMVETKVPEKPDEPPAAPSAPLAEAQRHEAPSTQERQDSLHLKEQAPTPEAQQHLQVMGGYLIQLAFLEGAEAEHWSDRFSGEGYSTAMSIAGEGQFVRLRIGSFPSLVEATDFLEQLRAQGLRGLVLQLPD
jgi:hypothetical protein